MALSSSSSSSISGFSSSVESNKSDKTSNFYESIYHLKKMFPKFELDVIESVLKSCNCSMEESIDQLLAISVDELSFNIKIDNKFNNNNEEQLFMNNQNSSLNDLPPSYYELMPRFKNFDQINKICSIVVNKDDRILNKLNSVIVGKLPKDFLRVKLNNEQLKALKKTNEYKDKYKTKNKVKNESNCMDELSKIMNNEENIRKTYTQNCKYLENFSEIHNNSNDIDLKQDLQDEYLAILLQNEEFLNCLKTDSDFMNTLNNEIIDNDKNNKKTKFDFNYETHKDADYSYGKDNFDNLLNNNINFLKSQYALNTISNEEFKIKLFRMGRASQLRFNRLAKLFTKKLKLNRFNIFNSQQRYQNNNNNNNEVFIYKGENEYKFNENEHYVQTNNKNNKFHYYY